MCSTVLFSLTESRTRFHAPPCSLKTSFCGSVNRIAVSCQWMFIVLSCSIVVCCVRAVPCLFPHNYSSFEGAAGWQRGRWAARRLAGAIQCGRAMGPQIPRSPAKRGRCPPSQAMRRPARGHRAVRDERRDAVGLIRHELQRTDPQENKRDGNSEGSNTDPLGNRSCDHTEYAKDICGHWKVSSRRCFKRLTPCRTRRECAWNTRAPRRR